MYHRIIILVLCFVKFAHTFPDIGNWYLPLTGESCDFALAKSLFKDSKLKVVIHCNVSIPVNITVHYEWLQTRCSPDNFHYFEQRVVDCSNWDRSFPEVNNTLLISYKKKHLCSSHHFIILDDGKVHDDNAIDAKTAERKDKKAVNSNAIDVKMPLEPEQKVPPITVVEKEGIYVFRMTVTSTNKFNVTVHVEMKGPTGYLSAANYPLLYFYGVMCGVYILLCSCWLGVCALQWRDLLRIQYWIGGVALLGMIESATYYGVYSTINRTGVSCPEIFMFAEWISVAKRALARMLVIIVSLGFGIVKPRLGPVLQRVAGAGLGWALLAAAEAWLRLRRRRDRAPRDLLLAEAPLSLLDSAICWWVFVSLAHTMRTLQLRRNAIKLSLYRHFTNTLIFAVISSVIFMLYSIKSYRFLPCITEWKEVWMDEAYWHILFASVLTAIMVLWRPTNNNQRYAFTPLLDTADDDDEEEEQFVNDAYGVKMRGPAVSGEGHSEGGADANNSLDSDLRWVEENIPTSTLPLLDSDEEIINTKFEVSKMQ